MCGKSKLCCLQIDIGVRIIGTISLISYVLVFIALVSDKNEMSEDDRIKIMLGLDSRLFSAENYTEIEGADENLHKGLTPFEPEDELDLMPAWIPIYYLFYSLFAAVSSALLIWASVTKERWLTIPWMICSVLNAGSQIASLTIMAFSHFAERHKWITAGTMIHSILVLWFFAIVVSAQFTWKAEKKTLSKIYNEYETWENIFQSPPRYTSPYKNKV